MAWDTKGRKKMKKKVNRVASLMGGLISKQGHETALIDEYFLEQLRKVKRDYGIRKAKITNDVSRRRIAKLVLDCFLRHHPLQHTLSVNGFQILATLIEVAIYQELNNLNLICKEPIDEEVRLAKETTMSKKESQKWALKLISEGLINQDISEDLGPKGKLLVDKIIQTLKGGKDNGTRRTKTREFISRKVDNIGDTSGTIRV